LIWNVLVRAQPRFAKMILLFLDHFRKRPPAPDFQETVKAPRVLFDFGVKRATVEHGTLNTRVSVPSRGQIDLEGAWGPPHAHVS
jgi:hypothetical protein